MNQCYVRPHFRSRSAASAVLSARAWRMIQPISPIQALHSAITGLASTSSMMRHAAPIQSARATAPSTPNIKIATMMNKSPIIILVNDILDALSSGSEHSPNCVVRDLFSFIGYAQ